MKLKDKVAIVTGASSGKGSTVSELLASEGASVIINYLKNKEEAESVLKRIADNGGKAKIWQADVTRKEDVEDMVKGAIRQCG